MTVDPGLYDAWIAEYQGAWDDPSSVPDRTCPTCGSRSLRLVFVVDSDDSFQGMAAFWCDACLTGLMPLRAPVPDQGTRAVRGAERIPNYRLITDELDE